MIFVTNRQRARLLLFVLGAAAFSSIREILEAL